ncbi:MAG: hypothetical protein PHF36_01200 [Candidatus Cloacimonetes bacterium]|nr:hypothetical protein [Candidatus Cloacimonadota bacterium]
MRKLVIFVFLFLVSISLFANNSYVVQNLTVSDIEYDDGAGLLLKWKPLDKSCRIIEYRIYRGVSEDSLFYLGKIDVDPVVGVIGDEMQFLDKDFRPFVDIESPARLKKEKGQPKNSPIYRSLPRDVAVVGPLLEKYSVLAIIENNLFYYKSRKIEIDNETYAGLKPEEFEALLANVLPGNKYYYTVIAVDEKRTFHPYADIVEGVSYPNSPEPVSSFYVKYIEDKNYLQYEFEPPLFDEDIANYNFYMLPKNMLAQFEKYKDFQAKYEQYIKDETIEEGSGIMPDPVENPAILINSVETSYPYPTPNFARVDLNDPELRNLFEKEKININTFTENNYFLLVCTDYNGLESFDISENVAVLNSMSLPIMPKLDIRDKPSDKGDNIELMIGRPIVYITQINSDIKNKRKLTLNYDLLKNDLVKVKKIKFKFYDYDDNELGEVVEHFFDNIIKFTLPDDISLSSSFKVDISFVTNNNSFNNGPYLTQFIVYNDDLRQLQPDTLLLEDEHLMDYRYLVLKKANSANNFQVTKRLSPLMNSFDDNIPYETHIFKGVTKYDVRKRLFLFDTMIDLGYDENAQTTLIADLFNVNVADTYKEQIKELEEQNNPELQPTIDYYSSVIDALDKSAIIKEANLLTGRKRINFLKNYREKEKRTFKYYLVKSNGKACFDISDIYTNEAHPNGEFFPKPDWFNMANLPMLIASLIFSVLVLYHITKVKKGNDLYIRPIAGLEEIDNAIGRATEMGRPILFVPGLSGIDDVATLAALSILGHITKKAAEYDTKILVPVCDYIVLPIAQQIVKEAHFEAGRPDSFDAGNVFFVADGQFAYVAGVNGVMIREKTATNFYLGMFYAEALLMTETGNATGAIQISGSDALTQIPFFITTCDYTLIGEELYAASAYLAREALLLGTLKAQDYTKLLIIIFIVLGTVLSSFHINFLINWFPTE